MALNKTPIDKIALTHQKLINKHKHSYFDCELKKVFGVRIIGINEYHFRLNDDERCDRSNIHYFSYEFDKILSDYKKNNKISDDKMSDGKIINLFLQNENNLSDLGWFIDGYY
jgi:hypothetical protein